MVKEYSMTDWLMGSPIVKKFNYTFKKEVLYEDCPLSKNGICFDDDSWCNGDLDERPKGCPLVEVEE